MKLPEPWIEKSRQFVKAVKELAQKLVSLPKRINRKESTIPGLFKKLRERLKAIQLRQVVFVISLLVFCYSSFMIVSILIDGYRNKKVYSAISEIYHREAEESQAESATKPEAGAEELQGEIQSPVQVPEKAESKDYYEVLQEIEAKRHENMIQGKFYPLLEINEDVVGWIHIPNTRIDYPVVQGTDNDYYMDHDIHGEESRGGAIFMDFRNNVKPLDENTILYGHHMKNGTMFKDLVKFKKQDFFEENRFVYFDTLYENNTWEIFSVYVTDTNFYYIIPSFRSKEDYKEFLKTIQEKSMYETDIELSPDDEILTLSTCDYTFEDARLVVHARRVKG